MWQKITKNYLVKIIMSEWHIWLHKCTNDMLMELLQWYSSGLASMKPWVQTPDQQKSMCTSIYTHPHTHTHTHTHIQCIFKLKKNPVGSIYQTFNSSYLQVVGRELCTLVYFRIFGCERVITFVKTSKHYFKEIKKKSQDLTPSMTFSIILIPNSTSLCFRFHNHSHIRTDSLTLKHQLN
jgi:hypothetical protein